MENKYVARRHFKYELFQNFEKENLETDLYSCLTKRFSHSNPKRKYINYLRYRFLNFCFENQISLNDLNLLAVEKEDISLILYSIYKLAQSVEDEKASDVQSWFIQTCICLEKFEEQPQEKLKFFFNTGILKKSQIEFFMNILNNYDENLNAFLGTYEIIDSPFFHFKHKKF